ncbi:MAG TPA: hypothetical protein VHS09_02600 [Polyangiaceae bacterium]|nr:hypothetical protein [Polyangiaceae bacterium]
MTTGAFDRLTRLSVIFNSLRGERFIRRSLLLEFIELCAETPGFAEVRVAASRLLRELDEGLDGSEYDERVTSIGVGLALLEDVAASQRHPPTLPDRS